MAEVKKGRTSIANRTLTLAVGDEAPDFRLASHALEDVTLRQYRGRKVVLLFMSAAWTTV